MKKLLIALTIFTCMAASPVQAGLSDKEQHIIGSMYLVNLFHKSGATKQEAFLLCIGVGILKEAIDAMGYGTPDMKDLVADAAGCVGGLLSFRFDDGYVNLKYCKIGSYKGVDFTNRWSCVQFRLEGKY